MTKNKEIDILIINAFTWLNKGDSGILVSTVESLNKTFNKPKISVVTVLPHIDSIHYEKYGINILKNPFYDPLITNKSKPFKIFRASFNALKILLYFLSHKKKKQKISINRDPTFELAKKYLEADIIISCGGGYLHDEVGQGFLTHLFQIFLSVILNKPTVLYAQSIGPYKNKIFMLLTGIVLNNVSLITLREGESKKWLEILKVRKPKIIITADEAFLLKPASKERIEEIFSQNNLSEKEHPLIGITIRRWHSSKTYLNFLQNFAKTLDILIDSYNAKIVFIPQCIGPKNTIEDDIEVANDLYKILKNKNKLLIISEDYEPGEIKGLIGKMDIFIGTRMHSTIFSLSMLVPTISIAYQIKTYGVMEMLGLQDFVCDYYTLDAKDLLNKTIKLLEMKYITKNQFSKKIEYIKSQSNLNVILTKELLEHSK